MGSTPMVDAVRGITLCMAILCTIVCCLRLYMRWFVVKSFNVDDYLVIVALILVNGFSALAYTISYYGLGDHQADVIARGDLVTWLKIYYAALCSYLVVAATVKLSLTTFIMRIFPQRYVQRTGYAIIVFIVAFTVSGELILAFQCKPVRAFWDKTIITAQCFSNDTLFAITMYQGVLMFVCDIVIIVLPMPAIWRLQMALKKRLLVLFLFSFGVIACIAALVRFSTLVYTKDTTDMTYSAAMSLIWMEIEFNFGLLAGSLGSLRKLFKIKSIFSSGQRYGSSRRYELDDIRGTGSESAPTHYLSKDNRRAWKKGGGILKSYEVTSTVDRDPLYDEFEGRVGRRPDSQEHIMLENGNGMVYGQGDPIKVHIRAAGP